jgi:hypothetical protein
MRRGYVKLGVILVMWLGFVTTSRPSFATPNFDACNDCGETASRCEAACPPGEPDHTLCVDDCDCSFCGCYNQNNCIAPPLDCFSSPWNCPA